MLNSGKILPIKMITIIPIMKENHIHNYIKIIMNQCEYILHYLF
jgi:hypothetical protein